MPVTVIDLLARDESDLTNMPVPFILATLALLPFMYAVAATAIKTTSIIPVNSIQILSEGTSSGVAFKPDLYRNTAIITGIASAICLFIEVIVCLFMSACCICKEFLNICWVNYNCHSFL